MKNRFFLFLVLFAFISCENLTKNEIVNQPDSKIVLDSTIKALKKYKYQKDTVFGNEYFKVRIQNFLKNDQPIVIISEKTEGYFEILALKKLYLGIFKENKFSLKDSIVPKEMLFGESFYAEDINFDGKDDLVVKCKIFSRNRNMYQVDFFRLNDLKKIGFLNTKDSIFLNKTQKTLLVSEDGGEVEQSKEIYHWQADTLQLLRHLTQSVATENTYFLEELIFKNNEIEKSTSQEMKTKEAKSFFEKWE